MPDVALPLTGTLGVPGLKKKKKKKKKKKIYKTKTEKLQVQKYNRMEKQEA